MIFSFSHIFWFLDFDFYLISTIIFLVIRFLLLPTILKLLTRNWWISIYNLQQPKQYFRKSKNIPTITHTRDVLLKQYFNLLLSVDFVTKRWQFWQQLPLKGDNFFANVTKRWQWKSKLSLKGDIFGRFLITASIIVVFC